MINKDHQMPHKTLKKCGADTLGIRIANIQIMETFELRTFACSLFEWSQLIQAYYLSKQISTKGYKLTFNPEPCYLIVTTFHNSFTYLSMKRSTFWLESELLSNCQVEKNRQKTFSYKNNLKTKCSYFHHCQTISLNALQNIIHFVTFQT